MVWRAAPVVGGFCYFFRNRDAPHQELPSLETSSDTESEIPKENHKIFFKPKGSIIYAHTRNRTWVPRGVKISNLVRYHYAIWA